MLRSTQIGFSKAIFAIFLQLTSAMSFSNQYSFVAIIIDDIGHNKKNGQRAININAPLTLSVIPGARHADILARNANASGKEVMIHLPMEPTMQVPLGNLALTSDLSEAGINMIVEEAIKLVPFAKGINNHMGSALTQQPKAMSWLMRSVKRHNLFFIDSRTTHKSIASKIAVQHDIRSASRDIFLDNKKSTQAINIEFGRLLALAKRQKTAIAIGHPHPSTLQYLEHTIPMLENRGIKVISITKIIEIRLVEQGLATEYTANRLSKNSHSN